MLDEKLVTLVAYGAVSPKGYYKDGQPTGGRRQGAGRKAKSGFRKATFSLGEDTLALIKQLPRGSRTEIVDRLLKKALREYFHEGGKE